jgi:hypothetical protein
MKNLLKYLGIHLSFQNRISKLINNSADMCPKQLLGLLVFYPSLTLSTDIFSALLTKAMLFISLLKEKGPTKESKLQISTVRC